MSAHVHGVLSLLALTLIGCPDGPCRAGGDDLERQACLFSEVQRETSPDSAGRAAARISDPLVRDVAIVQWMSAHAEVVTPAAARELCGMLSPRERDTCLRRQSSPHLSR